MSYYQTKVNKKFVKILIVTPQLIDKGFESQEVDNIQGWLFESNSANFGWYPGLNNTIETISVYIKLVRVFLTSLVAFSGFYKKLLYCTKSQELSLTSDWYIIGLELYIDMVADVYFFL